MKKNQIMKNKDDKFLEGARFYFEERKRALNAELQILRPKHKDLFDKLMKIQRRLDQIEREYRNLENISAPHLFD